jgi:hypothetical protein
MVESCSLVKFLLITYNAQISGRFCENRVRVGGLIMLVFLLPFIKCFKARLCGLKFKIGGMQLFHSGGLWKKLGDGAFGLWCGIDL